MSEADAQEISGWRYTGEFALYNPDEAALADYAAWLLEPANGYFAIYEWATLIGFCCFGADAQVGSGDYSLPDTLDIGLGMRPDMTGQGRGTAFLEAILSFVQSRYGATHYRATIAAFNQRSQRIFEKAGFSPKQRFVSQSPGNLEFVVMVKLAYSR
jgi:RimJ/RimL family protein N-acetyltransferase